MAEHAAFDAADATAASTADRKSDRLSNGSQP
jgi:hypothetical protein